MTTGISKTILIRGIGNVKMTVIMTKLCAKVRASHLLVKHRDSRRASSWREENITRTKEEALQLLMVRPNHIKNY
jgi:hypothetical protein